MSSSYCRVWSPCASPTPAPHEPAASPDRASSLFSRVTSLRSSPRSARSDLIVAFWFSACSRVARSRRLALSAGEVGLCLVGSMLASERSFPRRVTSACRESASFAVRRDFLRLLDRRLQLAPAPVELPLQGTRPGTGPPLPSAALHSVLRPRPHASVPLRAGMLPLAFRTPVSRARTPVLPRETTKSRRRPQPASGLIQNPRREPPCARR